MHDTLRTFGYPETMVREYTHWAVMVRPQQITVGSLVLVCKEDAHAVHDISQAAFTELKMVTTDIENALKQAVDYQKINYMALMMVDKEVHFHVLPRYEGGKTLAGITLVDAGWPKLPDMASGMALDTAQIQALKQALQKVWNNHA